MKLMFIGAAHEVTGSCHYLEVGGKHILIDCGMEQGKDIYQNQNLPVSETMIDFVLLTHAHMDHAGLLPLLYAKGFRGNVYTTKASCDLCNIMLRDSAHIQMFEAEWRTRKAKRAGQAPVIPLYDMDDAISVLEQFCPCNYNEVIKINENIAIRFTDVGHLLGSASIEIWLKENNIEKKIVFSGDIGNSNQPLIKDPEYTKEADYVVMESTYGDRLHTKAPDYVKELSEIIQRTFEKGGNVVIPSFAVGRTQEMLYFIRKIKMDGLVKGFPNFPVYVDSPLAIEATNIFNHNIDACFDEEAMELVRKGINPIDFPGLKVSVSSEESKAINSEMIPKVILSASGMCEAGRIRHHLKHNLWRPECTVLFVGYQAVGTLGRNLLEGAKTVKLFGETIEVHANIQKLDGVSGHADKNGLINWVKGFEIKPQRIFVVHGEDGVCDSFAKSLEEELEINATAPFSGSVCDLATGISLVENKGIPIEPKDQKKHKKANDVFERLLAALARLTVIIHKNEGTANKDLAKFSDQINALCDKWDR